MTIAAGARLGPYEIVSLLGTGGMGEVYRAHDTRLNRDVAIKVLPAAVVNDPTRRARFEREAQAIAQLSHPHICAIHDIGEEGGVAFIVMEYISGQSLAERLRLGPIPWNTALSWAIDIASAIDSESAWRRIGVWFSPSAETPRTCPQIPHARSSAESSPCRRGGERRFRWPRRDSIGRTSDRRRRDDRGRHPSRRGPRWCRGGGAERRA